MNRYPTISDLLSEKLSNITPSQSGRMLYYPCQVTLSDDTKLDRVYVAEEQLYFKHWGVYPEDDRGKLDVSIAQVKYLRESPYRLPAELANKMYKHGESGMGYCIFTLIMRNGDRLPFLSGNAVDFVELPFTYLYKDIIDLLPGVGREKLQDEKGNWLYPPHTSGDRYAWCLFSK